MPIIVLGTASGRIAIRVGEDVVVLVPGTPTGLSSGTITSSSVLLTWVLSGPSASSVEVRRSPAGASTWTTFATLSGASVSTTATGLTANTSYDFSVRSVNSAGSSAWSSSVSATTAASGGQRVALSASDFTFAGWYRYQDVGNGMTFAGQLTHRYVGGELRFLATEYADGAHNLIEFRLPSGAADGRTIGVSQKTNSWAGPSVWPTFSGSPLAGHHHGISWDEAKGGLWGSFGIDYAGSGEQVGITRAITFRTLNSNGTVSNHVGPWGFQGVSQRCVMGKVLAVPGWAQTAHGIGPYLYGFGGYTSLIAQGGTGSLGLFAASGPDVTGLSASSGYPYGSGQGADFNVPSSAFSIVADHRGGTGYSDWYDGESQYRDRGIRSANVVNYCDLIDQSQALPGAPPVGDPTRARSYRWQSPAPDGKGRFVYGDSYFATPCIVSGPSKSGLVCIMSAAEGKAYYNASALNSTSAGAEIHAFSLADIGSAKAGQIPNWSVQPVAIKRITDEMTGIGMVFPSRQRELGGAVGATFDETTKKLWVAFTGFDNGGYGCALVCYDVNC